MPATKPTPAGAQPAAATAMYRLAAECKRRLLDNLIAAELGKTVDPQQFIDDAVGAGIPFSKVAEASETLHTRRMRVEAYEAADWNQQCEDALAESRVAQGAVPAAQAAFEAARLARQAAHERATAAVNISGQVQRNRTEAINTFAHEMRNDAGTSGDVNDWKNVSL